MSKDDPVEKILAPFGESKSARRKRLLQILIVRGFGVLMLYVCYQLTSVTLTQDNIPKVAAMFFGAIVLVFGFIGLVLTFGKIEKTKRKGFDMSVSVGEESEVDADAIAEAWSKGYDEGYDDGYVDAETEREEDEIATGSESGANSQPQ